MKKVILVTLILILASCNDVKKSDACACDKLKSEPDCKAVSTCAWTAAVAPATGGTCAKPTTPTTVVIKAYCELVETPATACWKTVGCAYVDAKCTHFTGCTAYVKTTDADCQAISKSCTSDGVTCISTKSCTEYTTSALCSNTSNSGTGKCKWDTTGAESCRNYTCSEGDATNTTDALCNTYLAGCVTNGKGCVTAPRPACATYLGDATTCAGYKGSDGNCEGVTGGTNCRARVCTGAPATNTTNALCAEYQTGCITSGKGCVTSPLPACSTYAGDATTCVGYNGSDGICEGDAAGTACRGRNCTNAPSSSNTDALCVAYKTGCVTTGKGCVATRGACSGYTGTSTTCVGFQGSDGYCKGTSSTTVGACSPMVCTEAAATLNTDAACAAYQIGCRTTGKGCIATLGACSSYNGTATSCDGYVGTDGKCKGTGTTSAPCAPKVCSEAPITLASNTECANYQTGCVTNGTGCVAITSCPNTIKQLSCTGTTGCGWQNSCLAITLCSDFITQGTCLNNQAGLTAATKKPCYWTGSACRDLACTDAATTFNTDSQCNTHLAGCVTNARGCVALTAPCSNYQGTQSVCANFTKRCWNDAAAVATTVCLDRTCAHDVTSTTDGACISFLSTCLTKGAGCIEKTALCTAYLGTQATCNGFKGNNQVDFCYNTAGATAATPCTVKVCTDNTTASSDGDCGTFLTGCLWNGATGCVAKTAACSSYTGTTTTCANYKGVNGTTPCWTTSTTAAGCVDKTCSHAAATLITDSACKDFLSTCLTNGAGCVSSTLPCSQYNGDANTCTNFTGNSKKCFKKDSCGDRVCGDITTAANQAACDAYLPNACQLIGTTCTSKVACASYTALASQCQTLTGTDGACWSSVGQSTSVAAACVLKTCTLATAPASQTDCTNWITNGGCRYSAPTTGKVCVNASTNCAGISGTASECQIMIGADGACWSAANASVTIAAACIVKDCTHITAPVNQAACNNFLPGCRWSAPTTANICLPSSTTCAGLSGTPSQCQAMTGFDGACWSAVGALATPAQACVLKICSLAAAPADANTCQTFTTTGCRLSKPTSGSICKDWNTTCAFLVGIATDCQAWTGYDGPCWSQASAGATAMSCVLKQCNQITATPTSQASCDAFMPGCVFNGATVASCLDFTKTNCAQLSGTAAQCNVLKAKDGPCWAGAAQSGTTIGVCKLRTCSDKSAPESQSDCTTHMAGCLFRIPAACLPNTTKCSGLTLTPSLCQAAIAADGQCWSAEGAGVTAAACVAKTCSLVQLPTASTSCSGYMAGCQFVKLATAGICRSISTQCSGLWGSPTECQGQTGSDGMCTSAPGASASTAQACVVKTCGNITPAPSTEANCTSWISTCHITKAGATASCIPAGACSTYTAQTAGDCVTFFGATAIGSCYDPATFPGACREKTCANITTAPTTETDCTNWLPTCHLTKAAAIFSCIPAGDCSTFTGRDWNQCPSLFGPTGVGSCVGPLSGPIGPCAQKACSNINMSLTQESECLAWLPTCHFTRSSMWGACIVAGPCSTYISRAGGDCPTFYGNGAIGSCLDPASPGPCVDKTCANITPAPTTETNCTTWLSTCHLTQVTATGSCIPAGACNTFTGTTAGDCVKFWANGPTIGTCTDPATLPGACVAKTCQNIATPTNEASCTSWLPTCKFSHPSAGAICIVNTSKCSEFQGTLAECQAITAADGACWSQEGHTGTMNCLLKSCGLKLNPSILTDCTGFVSACLLSKPTSGNLCVPNSYTCAQLIGVVADCQSYTAADGQCWNASTGSTAAACQLKTCAHKSGPTNNSDCSTHLSTCIITQPTTGNICIQNTTHCNQIQGTASQCQSFTGGDGSCWSAIGASSSVAQFCVLKTCELLVAPTDNNGCNTFLPGCKFSRDTNFCTHPETSCAGMVGSPLECQARTAKDGACWSAVGAAAATIQACVLKSTLACNAFTGDGAYCTALTQTDGKCWFSGANATTTAACKARTCADDVTSITDAQCATHLTGCKTKGVGCVASSTTCSALTGTSSTCPLFTSSTGNKCKFGSLILSTGTCQDKSCYDDVTSATNQQCEAYFSGCLTKGAGCVPNTAPCSEYSGVQATCGAFVGSSGTKKCWNSASAAATTACAEKQCTDDVASTTDAACAAFLTGCITKGVGCVPATSACSTFSGTTATCGNFKGTSGTKLCWNISTATATTACVEKMCSHNTTSITDTDCAAFLPQTPATANPLCVTNGTGCVDYPRLCSAFTGTTEACGKFRASDGPCKSSVLTGSGACTPRICTEALNNLNTDVLCKAWHSSCVTNGYGCVTSVACSSVTEMTSCNAKTGCGWLSSCQTIGATCSSLTALGQSICVNTPVTSGTKACGWFNSVCRDLNCDDLSANLTTDTACAAIISTCTTKGAGCVTKGLCSTYSSKSICEAAKTTNVGDTCIWDTTNVCRAKKCTDAPTGSVTNTACDAYLTTCKTNGMTCIDATSNCNAIRTQVACLKDGMNNPCLWVGGICQNYAKCEDVTSTTHAACQRYSPQCTTNGIICVAINKCEKTTLAVSCEIGTDGECGWLPAAGANAAKCQKFGACTDAIGTTLAACAAYDSTCITDGTKCVAKTTCGGYMTQIACETNGSDGTCQWTASGTTGSCRLRECSDATALNATAINSYSGCYSFSAKSKCSTDGAKCIPLAACQAYTVEAGCVLGTDGTCTYDLAVGATTGNKSCRVKVCSDFKLLTSVACSTALSGAGAGTGCVSNGTNCIAKAACSTYTAREACNGGGSDGICAFTAGTTTTPNVGTCKLMTACTDANNDQFACSLKPASCKFTSTTTGTTTATTCAAQTCATVATGTTCNPVPSFDGMTYSICLLANNVCVAGDGAQLSSTTCFSSSVGTYSWNTATSKCEACFISTIPVNTDSLIGSDGGSSFSNILQALYIIVVIFVIFG